MKTYIALLRGINVSGQKKILMAEFRDLLENNGFEKVHTYIQSGNIIFNHASTNHFDLSNEMEQIISKHYGFDVPVVVLYPEEIRAAMNANPFLSNPAIDETQTYFTFLKDTPSTAGVKAFEACNYPGETFILIDKMVYYFTSIGYGKAKFTNKIMEKKLGVPATTRNYKTTLKLISMTQD